MLAMRLIKASIWLLVKVMGKGEELIQKGFQAHFGIFGYDEEFSRKPSGSAHGFKLRRL